MPSMMNRLVQGYKPIVEEVKKKLNFYDRDENEDGVPKFKFNEYPALPKTIYIKKEERKDHMYHWYLYKLLRAIYVPWFYFMPSCFFFGQYLAPWFIN
jgi:hypothetical protein